jgi:hypothetical protein
MTTTARGFTTRCHFCDKKIAFDSTNPEYVGKNGRPKPLDVDLSSEEILGVHKCPEREQFNYIERQKKAKEYNCFKCGDAIIFDERYKSKNNRPVPLDKFAAAPHACVQR